MTATAVRERGLPFTAPMVLALRREVCPKTQTRRLLSPQPISEAECVKHTGATYGLFTDASSPGEWRITGPVGVVCSLSGLRNDYRWRCPYGGPGDILRVNESHRFEEAFDSDAPCLVPDNARVWYEADGPPPKGWGRLRPPRFMRKPFSRMKREIVEVRAQRLHDITEEDARAEGMRAFSKDGQLWKWWPCDPHDGPIKAAWQDLPMDARAAFAFLWSEINGADSWATNPWVWASTFRRVEA